MEKADKSPKFYEFGVYRLDCAERILWHGAEIISLPPRVFDTLCFLVQNHGKILSKQAMIDEVWGDSFVEEGNLTQNIYTLRRVLGTDENGKNFIETISKKGYRFSAEVKIVGNHKEAIEIEQNQKQEIPSKETATPSSQPVISSKLFRFKYLIPIAVAIVLTSLLAFFSYYFYRSDKNEALNSPTQKMEFRQLTFSGKADYPVIAPAGDAFLFVGGGGIFIQENDSENAVKLNISDENIFAFLQFSPDGKTISYRNNFNLFTAGDVFQVSRFGGEKKKIAENVWSGFSFSPNGNYLAFVRMSAEKEKSALVIKNLLSGEERDLVVLESPSRFVRNTYPSWSADGSKIAISISRQIVQNADSFPAVFDVASGQIGELNVPQLKQFEQIIWLPEGKSFAAIARENKKFFQIWEVSYPEGKLRRITNDSNTYRNLSISADGKKMIAGLFSTSSNLWKVENGKTENPKQITQGNSNRNGVVGLELTKNEEIIYSSRIAGNIDLWKSTLEDESKQQLTKNAGDINSQPIASSDGKYLYFNSNRSGNVQIWRMDAESGENQTQITFGDKETALFPQISPDGNILYYIKRGDKKNTIWRKFLDSGKEEILLIEGNITPLIDLSLSPDGKFLATCNISEAPEEESSNQPIQIAVVSTLQISQPMLFSSTNCQTGWTQDSKSFNYAENTGRSAKIWRQTLDVNNKPEMILDIKDATIYNFVWTNNEKNLVYSNNIQNIDVVQLVDFR